MSFRGSQKSGKYTQNVPANTANQPLPVVIALHGFLENRAISDLGSGLGDYGYQKGFTTITPQLDRFGLSQWDVGQGSADMTWLSEVLTRVESTLCVDKRRIFVTGLSMGAFASSSIGCQFADRIAAIAPVSGLRDFNWCRPSRPVPVISFHGTSDPIVSYTNPSVIDITAAWARRDGCTGAPTRTTIASDVVLDKYSCPTGVDVQLYSIIGGGHIWPGSTSPLYPEFIVGKNTKSIRATTLIWDFFAAHPMNT